MSLSPSEFGGKPLELSLSVLDAIGAAGMLILPETPTPGMIHAGAKATGLDEATIHKVYQAMVRAAE